MVPSTPVSIPSSVSLAINLIFSVDASMRIHYRMDMVVLLGTALAAILTAAMSFVFSICNFIMNALSVLRHISMAENESSMWISGRKLLRDVGALLTCAFGALKEKNRSSS